MHRCDGTSLGFARWTYSGPSHAGAIVPRRRWLVILPCFPASARVNFMNRDTTEVCDGEETRTTRRVLLHTACRNDRSYLPASLDGFSLGRLSLQTVCTDSRSRY